MRTTLKVENFLQVIIGCILFRASGAITWNATTACYGADATCASYTITCSPGETIQLGDLKYGTKNTEPSCKYGISDCSKQSTTCCSYNPGDTFTDFSVENRTHVTQNCAGQRSCSGWAPRLHHAPYSSYVWMNYACVPAQAQQEWIRQPSDTTVNRGDNVTLYCEAQGVDGLTHIWNRGTNPIFLNGAPAANTPARYSIEGKNNLVITGVTAEDDQFFSCTIFKFDSVQVRLTVQIPPDPPSISVNPLSSQYLENSVVSLTCSSQGGKPAPDFRWLRNGQRVDGAVYTPPSSGDTMGTSSSLIDVTLTRDDNRANYSCVVFNAANQNSTLISSRILHVQSSEPALNYSPGSCNFSSENDTCGYSLSVRWMIHQGEYMFHQRVTLIQGGKGDDFYAFFDSASPIEQINSTVATHMGEPRNTSYDLTSPFISPGSYRLSYWYILPATQSALDVLLEPVNATSPSVILTQHGKADFWNQTCYIINSTDSFQIIFRGYRWAYGQFIAIDNILLDKIDFVPTAFPTHYTSSASSFNFHTAYSSYTLPTQTPSINTQYTIASTAGQTSTLESSIPTQTAYTGVQYASCSHTIVATPVLSSGQIHQTSNAYIPYQPKPSTQYFTSASTESYIEHTTHTYTRSPTVSLISSSQIMTHNPYTPIHISSSRSVHAMTPVVSSNLQTASLESSQSPSVSYPHWLVTSSYSSPNHHLPTASVSQQFSSAESSRYPNTYISPSSVHTTFATQLLPIHTTPALPMTQSLEHKTSVTQHQPTPVSAQTMLASVSPTPVSSTVMVHSTQIINGSNPTPAATLEEVIHLGCTSTRWNVTVDMVGLKQLYPNASRDNVFFGDTSCRGQIVGDTLVFHQGLRECLTSERISNDKLMYENDLFYAIFDPVLPIIRHHRWTFSLECDVSRQEVTFKHVHHDVESHNASATAHYDVNLAFYGDPNFNQAISGNPFHVGIGDDVYVKVFTTQPDWTIKMHVHTCYTTPDDPAQTKYYLIKNGCEMDRNTHIISQSSHETRFVFQDFEYPTNHEGLTIYCDATFCKAMDYSTKCLQVCNPAPGN